MDDDRLLVIIKIEWRIRLIAARLQLVATNETLKLRWNTNKYVNVFEIYVNKLGEHLFTVDLPFLYQVDIR